MRAPASPRPARRRRGGAADDPARAEEVGRRLIAWFEREGADLPWRRTREPYAIWVAEVLLQQTRVAQARPYYERFLERFPTLPSLAEADLGSVLKVWEGAGYYGRARRLHQAARLLLAEHGGELPRTAQELSSLPGFGPYTSRSVAALAFGAREVALDANAHRVLSRLFLVRGEGPRQRARVEAWGRAALGERAPRPFNEGLMEVGQRFCSASSPRCGACPLRGVCRCTQELRDPGAFPPRPRPPAPRPRVRAAIGILVDGPRVLVSQRPPDGLLGGLWEFPGGKMEDGEPAARAVVREFQEEMRLTPEVVRPLGVVEHDYSHFHASLHVFALRLPRPSVPLPPDGRPFRWVDLPELRALPLPRANHKMLPWVEALLAGARPRRAAPRATTRTSRG